MNKNNQEINQSFKDQTKKEEENQIKDKPLKITEEEQKKQNESKTRENLISSIKMKMEISNELCRYESVFALKKYNNISKVLNRIMNNDKYHLKVYSLALKDFVSESELPKDLDIKVSYNMKPYVLTDYLSKTIELKKQSKKKYIEYANVAKEEGYDKISIKFLRISIVEGQHINELEKINQKLKDETLSKADSVVFWQCMTCGYETSHINAPELCPICEDNQNNFIIK